MRFQKYLEENYVDIYKYGGLFTEVYVNPNENEIRSLPKWIRNDPEGIGLADDDSVRFISFAPTKELYVWASEGGVHDFVFLWLHSKGKLRKASNSDADGIFMGYAQPYNRGKLKFTKGYTISGIHDWNWLSKYFLNMSDIISYIKQNMGLLKPW